MKPAFLLLTLVFACGAGAEPDHPKSADIHGWRELAVYGLWARIAKASADNRPDVILGYMTEELAAYARPRKISDPENPKDFVWVQASPWDRVSREEMINLAQGARMVSLKVISTDQGEIWRVISDHALSPAREVHKVKSLFSHDPKGTLRIVTSDLFTDLRYFGDDRDPTAVEPTGSGRKL
jgi:hypothetical protein